MVDLGLEVYPKMKPDALRLQLQTVLITYYKDIKGVVSASGCTKPKVVKRKFVDQDAANAAADIAADADAAAANVNANAATPATPPDGGAPALLPHPAGRSLHRPPALGARAGLARGGGQGVPERVLARPKADSN
jgi:hypothetical protein